MAAGDGELLLLTAAAVAVMVVLIAWLRLSAFVAIIIAALGLGLGAGLEPDKVVAALGKGFGDVSAGVGLILILGAVLGSIIAGAGGADRIAMIVANWKRPISVAWGMVGVALLIGLPMFFETGLAILMPIVLRIAQKLDLANKKGDAYILVSLPVLAGLSTAHGLLPPHPGPLAAIGFIGADLGLVLLLGAIVAIPAAAIAGPLFTTFMWTRAKANPPAKFIGAPVDEKSLPSLAVTLFVLFLPVLLIGAGAVANTTLPAESTLAIVLKLIGAPAVALLISAAAAWLLLGVARGRSLKAMGEDIGAGAGAVALILIIIGAGGSLKEMLVQSGVSDAIGRLATSLNLSAIVLGWLAAALMRAAVGSATVATVTAAGLIAPLAGGLTEIDKALTVLAIGAGSVILGHVNNSGFWMVREYLGMSVIDTLKTWSGLETLIALVSFAAIMAIAVMT